MEPQRGEGKPSGDDGSDGPPDGDGSKPTGESAPTFTVTFEMSADGVDGTSPPAPSLGTDDRAAPPSV